MITILYYWRLRGRDAASVRLLSPATWFHGVQVVDDKVYGTPVQHVGAFLTEFEFQRYQPRRVLTDLLNQFDLVQIVAGGPALANVARNVSKPVCLFIATLAKLERKSILKRANFLRKVYGYIMLPFISMLERRALRRIDHIFAETEYTRKAVFIFCRCIERFPSIRLA